MPPVGHAFMAVWSVMPKDSIGILGIIGVSGNSCFTHILQIPDLNPIGLFM